MKSDCRELSSEPSDESKGVYVGKAFRLAWDHGRRDGRAGMRYGEERDRAERPRCRRAYSQGFAFGETEYVLGRDISVLGMVSLFDAV